MTLIIFDLDGTIVDSRLDLANSTNEVLERLGASPLPVDQVASYVGEGAKVLVQRSLAAAGLDPEHPHALDLFREIYDRRLVEHTRPYDGIADVIRQAARHSSLSVLTNKPENPSRRLLETFDLASCFNQVIGGDTGFPRKPDPAAARHLMQLSGTPPGNTLFVGDSMIDVDTARNAGIAVCVAAYGFGSLRGELRLRGDELIAPTPTDLGHRIDEFMQAAGRGDL